MLTVYTHKKVIYPSKVMYYNCLRCSSPCYCESGYCDKCEANKNHKRNLEIMRMYQDCTAKEVGKQFGLTEWAIHHIIWDMTKGF